MIHCSLGSSTFLGINYCKGILLRVITLTHCFAVDVSTAVLMHLLDDAIAYVVTRRAII